MIEVLRKPRIESSKSWIKKRGIEKRRKKKSQNKLKREKRMNR